MFCFLFGSVGFFFGSSSAYIPGFPWSAESCRGAAEGGVFRFVVFIVWMGDCIEQSFWYSVL